MEKNKKMDLRIKLTLLILLSLIAAIPAWCCTSLIAGKKATLDGSTMITYAADSHVLYGELYRYPAADHKKGEMRVVKDWDTYKYLGEIPEVTHTYSVVGNMNEHQLAIAESTWGGRPELIDTTGIIDYGSMIYITLQRAKTAREAIKVMTDLANTYGYASSGESFSIADPNEVWIMEMIGKGNVEKGVVWVAIRIPDDCISGHANQARIHQIPFGDKENCMYSEDVISFARKQGYYQGKDEDFSFSKAYAVYDYLALRGCDARVWAYYNMYADDMGRYFDWCDGNLDAEILPLYVKPRKKVSVNDMKQAMRDHFDGTQFDMHNDIGGGPWKCPYRFRPLTFKVDGIEYTNERAIATQQTGFSFVAQVRNWLPDNIGGVLWFGVDDANTCVYVPMYCSMTEVPNSYKVGNGDLLNLSWDAAFWVNNYVANQAYGRYSLMIDDIRKVQKGIESKLENEQNAIEAKALEMAKTSPEEASKMLNEYSVSIAENTTKRYKELGDYLLVKFLDGNVKKEANGKFERTPEGCPVSPNQPGYDEKYYENIVKEAGKHFRMKDVKL